MGFSRQKCWSGLPLPSPGYLPNPGIEPSSPDYRQTIYCLSHRGTQWIKFYLASIMSNQSSNTGVGCHFLLQCMRVKSESEVAQSCPTLSDPMDCSLLGSSVHGIFQARVLEWGAIAFSVLLCLIYVIILGKKTVGSCLSSASAKINAYQRNKFILLNSSSMVL